MAFYNMLLLDNMKNKNVKCNEGTKIKVHDWLDTTVKKIKYSNKYYV